MITLNQNAIEQHRRKQAALQAALKTPAAAWFDAEMEKLRVETGRTAAELMTGRSGVGRRRARELSVKYNRIIAGKMEVPR